MLSVIIGRFQTPYLHDGHRELLDAALDCGDRVLVLIGTTASEGTDKNPLCFETRRHLFDRWNVEVKALPDFTSDQDWSKEIDRLIDETGFKDVMIFGGRDNSIEGYYHGKHPTKIIAAIGDHSATRLREGVIPQNSDDFRAGMIYQSKKRYPIVYSTVDVVVVNQSGELLLGKKGDKFCFVGGFVDVTDVNLVQAADRELLEETGLKAETMDYIGSTKIDDSRYKGTKDCIMTHIFEAKGVGEIDYETIKDKEFSEFKWLSPMEVKNYISDHHKAIFSLFLSTKGIY